MQNHVRFVRNISISLFLSSLTNIGYAETIRIGGTGAALGTMTEMAEAFQKVHPEHSVKVLPSLGSSGGLRALQNGALEIAVSSRDVNAEEKGAGLSAYKYGTTAFILVSNPKAAPQSLTKDSLADLYSGKQTHWSNGQSVRVILRPKGDSDTKQLAKFSPAVEAAVMAAHAKPGMTLAITDSDSADQIEKIAGAFGTSTLALVMSEKRNFNILPLDGVIPNMETLNNGSYPYTKDMYASVSAAPSSGTKQFIQFIRSPKGSEILERTGHRVPVQH